MRTNPAPTTRVWRDGWFAKAAAKGGWDVPKWPKQFGGPGWTPTQHYIWEQETATAMLPFDMPFGVGMLAPILMGYGIEGAAGAIPAGYPRAQSELVPGLFGAGRGIRPRGAEDARRTLADGKHYIVNGTKIWTTAAHMADWIFCLTRTDDTGKQVRRASRSCCSR